MKSPRKLILTVSMSVALLAGSVVAGAPAQAAGPVYWAGVPGAGNINLSKCLTMQQQVAANRQFRVIRGCLFSTPPGYQYPGMYFTYTSAY